MSTQRVLLLIMPFLTLRRPHLGVDLLKAGLHRAGIECDVRYFNLRFADIIGAALYDRIAEDSPSHHLAGEFIFTPALYGEDARPFEDFKASVADYFRPYPDDFLRQLDRCRNLSAIFIQECANQIDLDQYDIIGFTSTFQQNMASLALAQELKRRSPRSPRYSAVLTSNQRWALNCTAIFLLSTWFAPERLTTYFLKWSAACAPGSRCSTWEELPAAFTAKL